jgi:SOS response regulatory protein OraA/RecX
MMKAQQKTKRVVFVNTENQAKNKASSKLQYRAFDCDCGQSFAVETKSTIWVACQACKRNNI